MYSKRCEYENWEGRGQGAFVGACTADARLFLLPQISSRSPTTAQTRPLAMDCFAGLPLELVRDIIRHAADDAVRDDPGWVAALAQVSRTVNHLVLPILYGVVQVDRSNEERIRESKSSAFAFTRHLIVLDRVALMSWPPGLNALANIQAFTGELLDYVFLAGTHAAFRPHTLSSLPSRSLTASLTTLLQAGADTLTHIHMLEAVVPETVPSLRRFTRLANVCLELKVSDAHVSTFTVPQHLVKLCRALLELPQMQRVSVITGHLPTGQAVTVAGQLALLAVSAKEPRLFVYHERSKSSTPREGAFTLNSLWECGLQLYESDGEH